MPFYLKPNNEKVMNKFQWNFGDISAHGHTVQGRMKGGWKLITIHAIHDTFQLRATTSENSKIRFKIIHNFSDAENAIKFVVFMCIRKEIDIDIRTKLSSHFKSKDSK